MGIAIANHYSGALAIPTITGLPALFVARRMTAHSQEQKTEASSPTPIGPEWFGK
jgi:hypothetical protein